MSWLESLIALDKTVFWAVNTGLSNPLFDALLPWCREKWIWAPLYLFIASASLINFGKKGWLIVLGIVLTAGLADFTSSTLVKKNVQRIRPCNDPEMHTQVILRLEGCGSGYSFTSSHAANHFAAAVFLIGIFGRRARWVRPVLLTWAGLIAFSQVYVGVHYPLDILAGAALGSLLGWSMGVWGRYLLWRGGEK